MVFVSLAIVLLSLQSVGWKLFGQGFQRRTLDNFAFNSFVCGLMAVLFWGLSMGSFGLSLPTLVFGASFGFTMATCLMALSSALRLGQMAFTSLISSSSLLIPTMYGWIFLKEPVKWLQLLGIVVLFASLFLGTMPSKRAEQPATENKNFKRWLSYAIIACILNGILGILQKSHAMSSAGNEKYNFLAVGYTAAALFMLCVSLIKGKKDSEQPYHGLFDGRGIKLLLLGCMTAVGGGMGNFFVLYLNGIMAASTLFPIMTGGSLFAATMWGLILFKEKLTVRQIIGLLVGVVALLMLGMG